MRNFINLLLIAIFPVFLMGQVSEDYFIQQETDSTAYNISDFDAEEIENYIKEKKLKVKLEAGTFFGTNFGAGNNYGAYLAPHISYPISPKFSINAGAILSSTYGNLYYEPVYGGAHLGYPGNFNRTFIYVEGAYQLNEKVTLTGAVYKEINFLNNSKTTMSTNNYDYQGMIMGIDYKLGENVYIRGQVEFSNGANPYRNRSYFNPGNSFSPSPFNGFHDPF
ncbi:MAG: hypothetical protein K8R68_11510 [Bacteroidales bacterium]|nr:hypothetical protein [Bacteroidales bacterium]